MSLSKVEIKNADLSTEVWLDGVKQSNLIDIDIAFPIAEPVCLKLTHLIREVSIEAEAEVSHVDKCAYCGTRKKRKVSK